MQATTTAERRAQRALDYVVAFKWLAATGALFAAIAPAVMATADGTTLRGSISAYWNIEPRHLFWAPFSAAAALLFLDGVISYVSPNRKDYGGRWYNLALGVSLYLLTWFDKDNTPVVHFGAATVFFGLFIAVIAYTSFLGWAGRHLGGTGDHDEEVEQAGAQVSLVFLLLLLLTLVAWILGLVSFFFFELFALVNFALYYVQGSLRAFPYPHYEFPFATLNRLFRLVRIMRPPS
jgi:hypothetical protein